MQSNLLYIPVRGQLNQIHTNQTQQKKTNLAKPSSVRYDYVLRQC